MNINNFKYLRHIRYTIAITFPVLLCILVIFTSCKNKTSAIEYRLYEVYANDDITLTTEAGEIVFIPYGGLMDNNDSPYYGKVVIKLTEYENLLDSLSRFMNRPKFIHGLQLSFPIVDCTDEYGNSLKINAQDGYGFLLFMPLVPETIYKDSLITAPGDIFRKKDAFDSFDIRLDLDNLPPSLTPDELLAISQRLPAADSLDVRREAGLAYHKLNSIRALKHYLSDDWENAIGKFIRTANKVDELRTHQSDNPVKVPYKGFNILELYNRTGKTNILKIFGRNAKDWENSLLIIDWTGSMHRYANDIDSLVEKLEYKKIIKHLALYNDKPDPDFADLNSQEGFFSVDSVESLKQVRLLMAECASDYGGGQNLEESDYSALIRATSMKFPPWKSGYKQIIMLVDNNAPPRDTTLFNSIDIKTKIYVIAYGANTACDVNRHYHNLVKKFGGLLFAEGNQSRYDIKDSIAFHNCRNPEREKCVSK